LKFEKNPSVGRLDDTFSLPFYLSLISLKIK
jgi:hypothetical protein